MKNWNTLMINRFPKGILQWYVRPKKKKKKIERNNLTSIMNQSGSGDQKSSA